MPVLQYVPQEFRDWEVRLVDWQTQCSMLATDEGVTYRLKRLMPTVGCEADAQVPAIEMLLRGSCPALCAVVCGLAAAVCHACSRHMLHRLDLAFLQTASVSVQTSTSAMKQRQVDNMSAAQPSWTAQSPATGILLHPTSPHLQTNPLSDAAP